MNLHEHPNNLPPYGDSPSKLRRIAFQLVTAKNQKARRDLLKKNITPDQLPKLDSMELKIFGFQDDEISIIKNHYLETAEEEIHKARQNHIEIIFNENEFYPSLLSEIHDPPDFIYALGDKTILRDDKLAVVGSRKGSAYGWNCLNRLLPSICQNNLAVVSGMAYGIDSMAHKIAIMEKGKTIGVNAGGLLHLYPPGNRGLIDQIIEKGCIISEFNLDIVPRPFYFPIRNRIIAGVSRAILVVEAAIKSGSLITARLALEQNRDILAIPGNIDSPLSKGTNYLLQQGARLITGAHDILDELGIKSDDENKTAADFSKKELLVLDLMPGNEVKSIDYFVEKLDYSVSETISLLMGLILKNVVIEEAGGYKRIE
ncbi:MAG: DNA-processing protein DprA [Acidobacteria bacterium]|jgi:DNA processing protein|nr:DNA-processing protein DprA [Acidobacteriota bacterium]